MQHERNNFDALRLLGALLVVCSHQTALAGNKEPTLFSTTAGTFGVLIFFSISGYLVSCSWKADPSVLRFFARRFLRIWPGLAAVVVLTSLAALVFSPVPGANSAAISYLSNLYLRRFDWTFFPSNPYGQMNGPLWTIPLEVVCYVVVAVLGRLLGRDTPAALLSFAFTAIPAFMLLRGAELLSGSIPAGRAFLPYFGAYFLVGAAMAHRWPGGKLQAAALSLGTICLCSGAIALGLVLIVPIAIVAIGTRSWPVISRAGRCGDLSYGLYVWAWPVQQMGVLLMGKETPYIEQLAVTLAVTLPLAWLSWTLVEKQALRLKPRRIEPSPL